MASREYSKRLGVIEDAQLQAALDRFELGRLVGAEPAPGGLFGQNVFIDTTAGRFVFRGAPHWDEHREFEWHFQKERFFSRLVHESEGGPRVPWPYLLEEDGTLFGWPFALMPRLRGCSAWPVPPGMAGADHEALATSVGHALAALHAVVTDGPGIYDKREDALVPIDARLPRAVRGVRALGAAPHLGVLAAP